MNDFADTKNQSREATADAELPCPDHPNVDGDIHPFRVHNDSTDIRNGWVSGERRDKTPNMTRHLIVKTILVHAEDTGCQPREWTTQWRDAANWDPKAAIRCLREMAEDIPPEYSVRVIVDIDED